MQSKYYYPTLFLALLFATAYIYDYHNILFKPSQSIHQWRQTDGISISRNYFLEGMDFFKPQTHNLTSDNGTTAFSATSETPILNYFIAILYKIFGYHEFFFRLINMIVYFTGLFYLFKALSLFFKDRFWPVFISFLAFTSPVLVYYANNFLPNTTALSFAFIALYFFSKFYLY
ncbi:MAG: glycosyltransferase family 39 protein [Bacteroidales bacterium]|nr:glycosyltransferase family 39 protein [Bacteroidales bacterium]MCF8391828.1 glycosyltransferase family 39 protein [Bacteroidales bacterium]